jgi:DTW domain-containing protein YfiP
MKEGDFFKLIEGGVVFQAKYTPYYACERCAAKNSPLLCRQLPKCECTGIFYVFASSSDVKRLVKSGAEIQIFRKSEK